MDDQAYVDISKFSFDEFMAFQFDREAPPDTEKRDPWYWHTEVTFDPEQVCIHYVRLFREPNFLLQRFSTKQLEQGFWGIQSGNIDCAVAEIIGMEDLPFLLRENCVRSMFHLFERLFAIEPLETSAHMWWDSLCYDWHCGNRNRLRGGEDLSMQVVMFETLSNILALDSEFCQRAALHGLGHLHHPGTEHLVQQYLEQHSARDDELREYALAAGRFEVM
jgi:hypothetical protein